MAATTQTLGAILQRKYLPGMVRQFNADFPNLRYIRQNSRDVDSQGEKAIIAIELGLNEGGGFHGESADVESSGYPQVKTVEVSLKQLTFRARITYRLMRKARTTANAFARGAQLQMSSTREAMTLRANMYLWGDGTGVVARVVSWTSGTRTLVLDRAYNLANGGAPTGVLRPGMKLHILDTSTFSSGVSVDRGVGIIDTVSETSSTQTTVVVRTGHTFGAVALNDYVFIGNTIQGWKDSGETEDNRPAMGMLGFYDDALVATLQGLSSTDEPQWKPVKKTVDTTSAATTRASFRKAKHALQKQVRNGRILYLISAYEPYEKTAEAFDSILEFRNVRQVDAGFEVATYDGRPWFMDHTAPRDRVFFVPAGGFVERYAVDDFINFVDDGSGSLNLVPNKTVFDTLLTAVYEYGIRRRNVLVSVTGYTP